MCVSGDSAAGFFRRVWLDGPPPATLAYADVPATGDRAASRREAYSWGGLTSGSGSRALWMLLLPFMLANVAFWMYPEARPAEPRLRWPRNWSAALQRLFSLSLTVTLILVAVNLSTDLAGWQCGGSPACLANHGFLHFLSTSFFQPPGHRLAVATLVPLAVVALLWVLGNKSWNNYERIQVPQANSGAADRFSPPPIGERKMWNGARPVRKLRSLHVSTGFATAGIFLLAPLTTGRSGWRVVIIVLLALLLAVVAGALLVLLVPGRWRREPPGTQDTPQSGGMLKSRGIDQWTLLPWLTLVLVIAGGSVALFSRVGPVFAIGPLPWFSKAFGWTLLAQMALLTAIAAIIAVAALRSRQPNKGPAEPAGAGSTGGTTLRYRRGLGGLAGPVLMLLSWMLAVGFAAGLILRAADYLGTPTVVGGPRVSPDALLVPSSLYWIAAGAFCFLAATALVAAAAVGWAWLHPGQQRVKETYGEAGAPNGSTASQRARTIAKDWTRAGLTDQAPLLLAIMAGVLVAVTVAGVLGYLPATGFPGHKAHGLWLWQHASWLATAGSWSIGAAAVALIALGWAAYRNDQTRRTVGILWDLGTFWPRATHPLAPPCYSERTMPDLINRTGWLAPAQRDLVVLSAHSQGAVIAAALVLQLDPEQQEKTALLTYGNPVARLYSRYFPAYFGRQVLDETGRRLVARAPDQRAMPSGQQERSGWPWRNLYRASDPIGGPVFCDYLAVENLYRPGANGMGGDNNDVDRQFLDPLFNPPAGDTASPPVLGHSGYFDDRYFSSCLQRVILLAGRRGTDRVTLPADGAGGAGPGP